MDANRMGGREGARVLRTDVRVASLLANDARHRAITRLFAVTPEQQNLLTAVAILAVAQSVGEHLHRMLAGPAVPAAKGSLFVASAFRELLSSIAGSPARDTPSAGNLLALAMVAGAAGPIVVRSVRGARASVHSAGTGFHHRYGYLVDPGHWRERRARRAEASRAGSVTPTG